MSRQNHSQHTIIQVDCDGLSVGRSIKRKGINDRVGVTIYIPKVLTNSRQLLTQFQPLIYLSY